MTREASPSSPAGRRLLYWLAKACKEARQAKNVKVEHVAVLAGLSVDSVRRFERAETWPQDPDGLMAAYAELCGIEDALDLYQRALDLWREHGQRPLVGRRDDADPGDPQRIIIDAIREQVARGRPGRQNERAEESKPKTTRQAGS